MLIALYGSNCEALSTLDVPVTWLLASPDVAIGTADPGDVHRDEARGLVAVVMAGSRPSARAVADAYRAHGALLSAHLDGPFGLVLYDHSTRTLVATSDIASRSQLAFATDGRWAVVATTPMHVAHHVRVSREIDEVYAAHAIAGLDCPPAGTTALRDVRRLLPGQVLVARDERVVVQTADELRPRAFASSATAAACIEEFWSVLGGAVDRILESSRSPALSLSGGLDSAIVGASMSRKIGAVSALSMLSPRRPEADESASIAVFGRAFEKVRVGVVDCSDAVTYPAWPGPLRDDPPLVPLSFAPSRLLLWEAARTAGHDVLLDGEGGDEIFSIFTSALHALRGGRWGTAWQHLTTRKHRRSAFARAVLLPHMPPTARRALLGWWGRGGRHLPSYLEPTRMEGGPFAEASAHYLESLVHRPLDVAVREWLAAPFPLGSSLSLRHGARTFDLHLASPLLDRSVLELALGLASELTLSDDFDKAFLRRAAEGVLPESLRMAPKNIRTHEETIGLILTSPLARAVLRDASFRRRFAGWIRFDRVDGLLDAMAGGYAATFNQVWQLESLVTYADWYGRASRDHGVT